MPPSDTKLLKMAGVPENLMEDVGDIEKYLSELTGDLGTTLTVPLEQVKENLPAWKPAIAKEIHNVEEATQALRRIPMQQAKALEREGRLKLVPDLRQLHRPGLWYGSVCYWGFS